MYDIRRMLIMDIFFLGLIAGMFAACWLFVKLAERVREN